ncbi:MAG: M36 family metallopeptidase [Acidobacteriota bacterium]
MKTSNSKGSAWRTKLIWPFMGLAAVTAILVMPSFFITEAVPKGGDGLIIRTESYDESLPNYDIRTDKTAFEKLAEYRSLTNTSAAEVADIREGFVRGEESLRSRFPVLSIEYNDDIRIPEVIGGDVTKGRNFLTPPSSGNRVAMLRNFVKENNDLFGVSDQQVNDLKVLADYTNPDGVLSFVHLEQQINGIPVFRGEVKAGFTKNNEIIRVINNLAPGVDYSSVSANFGDPLQAVNFAARHINVDPNKLDLTPNESASSPNKAVFGKGDWATTAEQMYFPTEPGVVVPAYRVLIWLPVNAYYVIVDANNGNMLWRKNITADQTQSATFQVYRNSNAMIDVAESPAPLTPGPIDPALGTQGSLLSRTSITRIGNEAPYTFNNNGWITDNTNITDGNFVEAGIDRDGTNGVDAPQSGDTACPGAGCRVFTSTWNPPPGSPAPGDDPLTPQAQRGAVIQMFWVMNWYQSEMYRLGFTEAAFNFQANNFGRGGAQGDRVSAEGQDSSGTNNANFSTPADGGRGRMQMYIWTGPTPDRDGTTDAEIIIHEVTHGLSNRLHGNASGLTGNMAGGMGEGWSDFYAHAMLSEPGDPADGVYTTGGYSTLEITAGFTANFYYGIRRYPKARLAFTGGPNNKPHNAYTFSYLNNNCNTRLNNTNFAFARGPIGSSTCDQVHNIGEVWSSILWEVRDRFITNDGWAVGNRKVLQFVTDGMKLAPIGPTFITERNAIIAATQASGTSADVAAMWSGFAARGLGFSASIQNPGTGANNTAVTDGFDLPNLLQTPALTVTDAGGNNNGFPEPGEPVVINLPVTNTTGNTATGTTITLVGGPTVNYGTINNGQTVTQPFNYTIPPGATCGSVLNLTFNVNSSLGPTQFIRPITIGQPAIGLNQNFDGVTAPALPAGWVQNQTSGTGITWVTSTTSPSSAPNAVFANDPSSVNLTYLETPSIAVTSPSAKLNFKILYNTESGFDGGVLEIKIGSGSWQDILAAGGSFVSGGYNGTLSTGFSNPLPGRQAWTGNSSTYVNSEVNLPAAANGQNIQLRWGMGSDSSVAATGIRVDDVTLINGYTCSFASRTVRADFDGDGKSDLSIWRPSTGTWWADRTTAGVFAAQWGTAGDTPLGGDVTGDRKADLIIYRPATDPLQPDFWVITTDTFTFQAISWGLPGDIPMIRDFNGDGIEDFAVWRQSDLKYYILLQNTGGTNLIFSYGSTGDIPLVGDFTGDGKAEIATFRPSNGTWYIAQASGNPSGNYNAIPFGLGTDKPVPADYDGDGKDDIAVFRPSNGTWYIILSATQQVSIIQFGLSTDVPVPGDYDGDGKYDIAIYRNGQWWGLLSSQGLSVAQFGLSGDNPIPASYIPQ